MRSAQSATADADAKRLRVDLADSEAKITSYQQELASLKDTVTQQSHQIQNTTAQASQVSVLQEQLHAASTRFDAFTQQMQLEKEQLAAALSAAQASSSIAADQVGPLKAAIQK